jgi:hypothetical protein
MSMWPTGELENQKKAKKPVDRKQAAKKAVVQKENNGGSNGNRRATR